MVEPHPNTIVGRDHRKCRVDVTDKEIDLVLVGGGVGGVAEVCKLVSAGLAVALVADRLVGGECKLSGPQPTKTLLRPDRGVQSREGGSWCARGYFRRQAEHGC